MSTSKKYISEKFSFFGFKSNNSDDTIYDSVKDCDDLASDYKDESPYIVKYEKSIRCHIRQNKLKLQLDIQKLNNELQKFIKNNDIEEYNNMKRKEIKNRINILNKEFKIKQTNLLKSLERMKFTVKQEKKMNSNKKSIHNQTKDIMDDSDQIFSNWYATNHEVRD